MAWSPGAWKTEFIRRLLSSNQESLFYTLDLDVIRSWMPWYIGKNADQYTNGAIKILELLFDECLNNEYPFILDGTFTKTPVMEKNIRRLMNKWYEVSVFYIHTHAELAWLYTLYRWKEEGRLIPVRRFVDDYLTAPKNVCLFSDQYKETLRIFIVNKKYGKWNIWYELYPFENETSIHEFFDKTTFIDYNISIKVGIFKYYKFISHLPIIWKRILRRIIKQKEASLCETH